MGTRVVLDTNVLVSALGWGGKPEQCLELVFEDRIEAYATQSMIDELSRVLDYDRFEFSDEEKQSFLEIVVVEFHFTEPDISVDTANDPDDNVFLECAVAVDADYVISGDSDLLEVSEYDEIPILPPDEFLREFGD